MRFLNSFHLKMIAIVTMTIDHMGYILYPGDQWFRIVGRLAFPVFAFLIAEGYRHTRNVNKYLLRLSIFAIVVQLPFIVYELFSDSLSQYFYLPNVPYNIFFTLALGLSTLIILNEKRKLIFLIPFILFFAYYMEIDYGIYGVLAIVIMYYYKDWKLLGMWALFNVGYWLVNYYGLGSLTDSDGVLGMPSIQIYSIIPVIFILLYNGKQGLKARYLFYFYYPVHLLVLYAIDML